MVSMATRSLTVLDIMRLVATDSDDTHAVLAKIYDWEHARGLEIGKWFLASATAGIIALVTLLARADPVPSPLLIVAGFLTASSAMIGLGSFWYVSFITGRYAKAAALAARFSELKPFLQKLGQEGRL
jgi:hypothetical protein